MGGSPLDAIALPGLGWPLMKFAATELWYAMEVEPNGSGAAILSDLMAMMTPVADMKHAEPQPRRVYADVQQKNEAVRSARGVT